MSRKVLTAQPSAPTAPEPTATDIDRIIEGLKSSWTARVTVRRQSVDDIGIREIYVLLDGREVACLKPGQDVSCEVHPGPHRVRVHNTLFKKTLDFEVQVGEHVSFMAVNKRGLGTYSIAAFFLGGMPIYLSLHREDMATVGGSTTGD